MTAQDYLAQAYRLENSINSKLTQVTALNELATRAGIVLNGMPRSPNHATSIMADAIAKLVDLQAEINRDIDELIDLKREITDVIKRVDNSDHQTLLERRYLCFETWPEIAAAMGYTVRHLYRMHDEALESIMLSESCH